MSDSTTPLAQPQQADHGECEIDSNFSNIMHDFIADIKRTFPETNLVIKKWWKDESDFLHIEDTIHRKSMFLKSRTISVKMLFEFCQKKYPAQFTDLLYQSPSLFYEDADTPACDTEFLPNIHFKELFKMDISENTKETIWKYLQLVLFSVIGANSNATAIFNDTPDMIDSLKNGEFKEKFAETLAKIHSMFDKIPQSGSPDTGSPDTGDCGDKPNPRFDASKLPTAEELDASLKNILKSKLGKIASRMVERIVSEFGLDASTENPEIQQENLKKLMSNPKMLMKLMTGCKDALDEAVASGEIEKSELINEATAMMHQLSSLAGGEDGLPDILKQMGGLAGMAAKMGMGGMGGMDDARNARRTRGEQQRDARKIQRAAKRESLLAKLNTRRAQKQNAANLQKYTDLFLAEEAAKRGYTYDPSKRK